MKKVVTSITAAIFALGLTSAALAQTTQTPAKPEVKKESTAVQTPAAKSEVTKSEAAKPAEAKKDTTKVAKKTAKKDVKKGKSEKSAGVEKAQPEKK